MQHVARTGYVTLVYFEHTVRPKRRVP